MSAKENDLKKLWKKIRNKKNVTGFSGTLKEKISNNLERPVKAVRFYVEHKEEEGFLANRDLLPSEIDGVPTDVEVAGPHYALPLEDPKNCFRPSPAGVSAVYAGGTACTLGWYAKDLRDNKKVIIANNHCTAQENKLSAGHHYLQPSPLDGDRNKLGELKDFVWIEFDQFVCPFRNFAWKSYRGVTRRDVAFNRVDLGWVTPDDDADILMEVLNIGSVRGKRRGAIGETAKKMGRTTGYTDFGRLVDNDYYGAVNYRRGKAVFGPVGLISGNNFSDGGDSSSPIQWHDNSFAGLLFAGSTSTTLFCHYDLIESEGNLEIVW